MFGNVFLEFDWDSHDTFIFLTKRDNILNRCTKKYNEKKIILFIRSLGQLKR